MSNEFSPVFGYHNRPSLIDFSGHLAAVFFTTGCNFQCGFCHNAALLGKRRTGLRWEQLGSVCQKFRDDDWADGAVITGGEPTLDPELPELIRFLKRAGFKVKLDTNGSRPDVLAQLLPLLDYVAMDVKCGLEQYPALVGFAETDQVVRTIELLKQSKYPYEFRTTVIEGIHSEEELDGIAELLQGASKYVVQPFLPHEDLPGDDFRRRKRTSPDFLKRVAARLEHLQLPVEIRGG